MEGLNTSGKKYLTQEDLQFLDLWKPPAWLTSEPDVDAAEEFKTLLVKRCAPSTMVESWKYIIFHRFSSIFMEIREFRITIPSLRKPLKHWSNHQTERTSLRPLTSLFDERTAWH